MQASLTGHMVFSTLHTNDAPSTITRLRDMGVEPFLITATVEAILAQRLVRKICANCRTEFEPTREQLMELNLKPEEVKGKKFYYGEGCDKCNNLGFKGRTGLYELMIMNDDLRDLIAAGASTDQIRQLHAARAACRACATPACGPCSPASRRSTRSSARRCWKTKRRSAVRSQESESTAGDRVGPLRLGLATSTTHSTTWIRPTSDAGLDLTH